MYLIFFWVKREKTNKEKKNSVLGPTLSDPMDCSLPGSSIHGIFQARVLEWGAIAFSVKAPYWEPIHFSENLKLKNQTLVLPFCVKCT